MQVLKWHGAGGVLHLAPDSLPFPGPPELPRLEVVRCAHASYCPASCSASTYAKFPAKSRSDRKIAGEWRARQDWRTLRPLRNTATFERLPSSATCSTT